MKIYTKTGDKGETGIIGRRLAKNSLIIETLGTYDELNAALGTVIALEEEKTVQLTRIQALLFDIGALLANGKSSVDYKAETRKLEKEMDRLSKELVELHNFILPGGTTIAAHMHLARAICRRAERRVVELSHINETERDLKAILVFTNRLSDYLFILARYTNHQNGVKDILWRISKDRP